MSSGRAPVLGFVGIHAGKRTDQPISQNETIARLFAESGYRMRRTSAVKWPPLRTAHQIWSLLVWHDVDLIVVAVFSGQSFWIAELATRLGRLTNKRIVLFLHGGNLPVFAPRHRRWVQRVFRRADRIVAPSGFLADAFRDWGYDVRIIPNVLFVDDYVYTERERARPALMWMRTFHEHYDPLMAVRVLERVARVHPDATLTMGGADHGLLDATVAEARRLGVEDRIAFPGYMSTDAKRAAFAANDLFLTTNTVDNMPVSVLEAAASGLVSVATEVGGLPKLLHEGEDALLVPAGDDEAMADAVLTLIAEPRRFAAMSVKARQLALKSSWPEVLELWRDELELLLPDCDVRG